MSEREREIIHSQLHCSNGYSGQGWTRLNAGIRNSTNVSHIDLAALLLILLSVNAPEKAVNNGIKSWIFTM